MVKMSYSTRNDLEIIFLSSKFRKQNLATTNPENIVENGIDQESREIYNSGGQNNGGPTGPNISGNIKFSRHKMSNIRNTEGINNNNNESDSNKYNENKNSNNNNATS